MKVRDFGKKLSFLALVLGLVFSGGGNSGSDDDEDEKSNEPVQLYENVWADGTISEDGQTDLYLITVTQGTRYFVYLNDMYDGNGTKTAEKIGLKCITVTAQ